MLKSVSGFALCLALTAAPSMAQQPGDGRVGTAAAVRGAVQLAALGPAPATLARQIGSVVASGAPLFLGDAIQSGPGAGLQILLADETVFTIGPDARLTIDEFVYNPAAGTGRLTATVARGAFRMISGKIAAAGPDAMLVRTPVATIGIRGTIVGGEVNARGETFVVLLGPGPRALAEGQRMGRIVVSANAAPTNQVVEITRAGFGTTITGPTVPPQPPTRIDQARIQQLGASLQSRGQPGPSPVTPPGASPQDVAPASVGGATPIVPSPASFAPAAPTNLEALVVELGSAVRLAVQQANDEQSASQQANDAQTASTGGTGTTATASSTEFTLPEILRQAQTTAALPQGVVIPLSIQLDWSKVVDLDLHMTAPDGAGGRAHVYFDKPGSYNAAPFIRIGSDRVGAGGSEVIAINGLTKTNLPADTAYRVTVHNFGDQASTGTSLSNLSGAQVKVITGGTLDLSGNTGDRISGGTTRGVFTVPKGVAGNAWVVMEIDPLTRAVKPVGRIVNMPSSSVAP